MTVNVTIPPEDVWDFFYDNIQRMRQEIVIVAEDKSTGFSVSVTEQNGKPFLAAYSEDELVEGETCVGKLDCDDSAVRLYRKYIFNVPPLLLDEPVEDEPVEDENVEKEEDQKDEIYEREDELLQAFRDYCAVVLDDEEGTLFDEYPDEMEEIKEQFIDLLVIKHGFSIRRPTFIDNKDGKREFVEYPYDDDETPT